MCMYLYLRIYIIYIYIYVGVYICRFQVFTFYRLIKYKYCKDFIHFRILVYHLSAHQPAHQPAHTRRYNTQCCAHFVYA